MDSCDPKYDRFDQLSLWRDEASWINPANAVTAPAQAQLSAVTAPAQAQLSAGFDNNRFGLVAELTFDLMAAERGIQSEKARADDQAYDRVCVYNDAITTVQIRASRDGRWKVERPAMVYAFMAYEHDDLRATFLVPWAELRHVRNVHLGSGRRRQKVNVRLWRDKWRVLMGDPGLIAPPLFGSTHA